MPCDAKWSGNAATAGHAERAKAPPKCTAAGSKLLDVELSEGHAKIVFYLSNKTGSTTSGEVHQEFDRKLGSEVVSALLRDLNDLGIFQFPGTQQVEMPDTLILE